MDGIGARTLDYYARQRPESLDARSLSQRAEALRLMGQISEQRGHMAGALRAYEAASATTQEQLARSPNDGQRIFDHAQSVFYVGEVAYQRGEWAKAEAAFQTYLALATRLTRIAPGRDDWRLEVGYAQSALGVLYLVEGRDSAAVEALAASLAISRSVAAEHPADVDDALALGQAYAWLADGLEKEGRLGEARAQRRAQLALYATLLVRDPTLIKASFSTIPALRAIARIDLLGGDSTAAVTDYRAAASRAEALRAVRPDDMDLASEVALAEIDLGETLLSTNRPAEADACQKRAAAMVAADLAYGPLTQTWRTVDARARLLAAALRARAGDHAGALVIERTALAALTADPQVGVNTDARWLIDRARLQTGDDLAALGRGAESRTLWSAAAADLSGPLDRYEPRLLLLLRDGDSRLGRAAEARAAAERLAALLPPANLDRKPAPTIR
jgi:tetratricopeptide (TPR) repeat protein